MAFRPDVVLAPAEVKVSVGLEPGYSALMSMMMVSNVGARSGFAPFIYQVAGALTPEQAELNRVIFWAMGHDTLIRLFPGPHWDRFDALLDALKGLGAEGLRDQLVEVMFRRPLPPSKHKFKADRPDADAMLADVEVLVGYLRAEYEAWQASDDDVDVGFETLERVHRTLHSLLDQPDELFRLVIGHLDKLWENWFRAEWERALPGLQETVAAYRRLDFSHLTAYEAMRAVTGRDLTGIIEPELIAPITQVHFVPSPHNGPYVGWSAFGETLFLDFGARLPAPGRQTLSPEMALMVIAALDDEMRLDILRLLAQRETLCSQDIIERFNLSQSTASRHLRQLSANGLVVEWREEGAKKCYRLNRERIAELQGALGEMFLGVESGS